MNDAADRLILRVDGDIDLAPFQNSTLEDFRQVTFQTAGALSRYDRYLIDPLALIRGEEDCDS